MFKPTLLQILLESMIYESGQRTKCAASECECRLILLIKQYIYVVVYAHAREREGGGGKEGREKGEREQAWSATLVSVPRPKQDLYSIITCHLFVIDHCVVKLVLASASLRGDLDLDVLSSLPAVWSSSGQGFQHQTPHRRFEEGHGGGLFSEAGALTQSGFRI